MGLLSENPTSWSIPQSNLSALWGQSTDVPDSLLDWATNPKPLTADILAFERTFAQNTAGVPALQQLIFGEEPRMASALLKSIDPHGKV